MKLKKRTKKKYRLRVGQDGPEGRCEEVLQIHHVSHLRPAQRILRNGRIPGLQVERDSRLGRHDVAVCWLAPNPWVESHFGTVKFTFDLEDTLQGRDIYWVEGVKGRGPDTCRLLITSADVTGRPVKAYDPERTEGPLRRFGGKWFRKAGVHLELMIEGGLPLTDCKRVSTALHKRGRCNGTCREVGRNASASAALLLTGLMRSRYSLPSASYVDSGRASALLHDGWFGLLKALDLLEGDVSGKIKDKERVDETVRKALRKLAKGDAAAAARRVKRIAGVHRVRSSMRRLLQRGTGIELGHPNDTVINLAASPGRPVAAASWPARRATRSGRREAREHDVGKPRLRVPR